MPGSLSPIALMAAAACAFCAGPALAAQARYRCDGGTTLVARFSPPTQQDGRVALTFGDGRKATLPQAPSADGGRYVGAGIEFWIKGRSATLTRGGAGENCQAR
jgi:membrane-bound inhibitor of C-type lysozyme